jgi:hypothetical protein
LRAETFFVLGLRYPRDIAGSLLQGQGVEAMRDSLTYQAVPEGGRAERRIEEARRLLLQVGERRFGSLGPSGVATLAGLNGLERIEQAIISVSDAVGRCAAGIERP